MADRIADRLRAHISPCSMKGEPPCVRCAAADEIERLRRALALACGLLSTYEDHSMFHPEALMQQFLHEAADA